MYDSYFLNAIAPLLTLGRKLPVLYNTTNPEVPELLSLIHFRLRQLDVYVVAQYNFEDERMELDIKDYATGLEEFGENVSGKIDFMIDIGRERGGWDGDIGRHLEEVLTDIKECSTEVMEKC